MTLNQHAWSKVANVIYLDSPAGVGLSYSETRADYVTNDTATAADANTFLRRFFEEYPEFRHNDLYIAGARDCGSPCVQLPSPPLCFLMPCGCRTGGGFRAGGFPIPDERAVRAEPCVRPGTGESYGGVYVPLLAQAVLDGNDGGQKPRLRLKVGAAL